MQNATVTFRMVDNQGTVKTGTTVCVTASTGRCSLTWNRPESRSPVTATVLSVSATPAWDNVAGSVLLREP